MTLIANMQFIRVNAQAGVAYTTPTVVHFGAVLLLSAVVSTPWHEITTASVLWGLVGLFGVAYVVFVAGGYGSNPSTRPCSRTGCVTFCFHLRRTQFLPFRRARLTPIRAQPCSSWALRCCFCSLLAFTMPGTLSRIMSSSRDRTNGRPLRVGQ